MRDPILHSQLCPTGATIRCRGLRAALLALCVCAAPVLARAQVFNEGRMAEAPLGYASTSERDAPISTARGVGNNRITGATTTTFGGGVGTGVGRGGSGVGINANATAIGNLVSVVVNGSNNTIVVQAQQLNTGVQNAQVALGR